MRYELFIGFRYLRARRKEAFISLITLFSTVGVVIGTMTLNIVLSVMTGFEEDLRDRILGFNPHVLVHSLGGRIRDYPGAVDRVLTTEDVSEAGPLIYGQAMVASGEKVSGVLVRGVLPVAGATGELERHLEIGHVTDLGRRHTVALGEGRGATVDLPGIVLGTELLRELDVDLGDPVSLISPLGRPTAVGLVPRIRRFAVTGVFDSGMAEYNSGLVYVGLTDAQRFFDLGDAVTVIEVRVEDLYEARDVAAEIRAELGSGFVVRDWMEMNEALFSALSLEKTVYFIVLLLIVLVAAFNIVATLIMVVMEKRKDIAILKSMGASPAGIARIFILKGAIIGLVGTVLGALLGWIGCVALRRYPFPLPEGVFYVTHLPVQMHPEYFLGVSLASLAICLLATIYPARQAARLAPVDVIRYE